MTEERKKRLKRKLMYAREALKNEYGRFALPLWDMYFVATEDVWRVSTNGLCIYFDPNWLQKLNEEALAFILAHELMHIELKYIRRETYYRGDRFHLACDIVANSHLAAMGWEAEKVTVTLGCARRTTVPTAKLKVLLPAALEQIARTL